MNPKTYIGTFVLFCLVALLLPGCFETNLEDDADVEVQTSDRAFFDDDQAAVQILDATSNDAWVYFDLESFSVLSPVDPAEDLQWDIAFQRFKVRLNGGVSGKANVSLLALHETSILALSAVPSGDFVSDRRLDDLTDEELLLLGDNLFFSVCQKAFDNPETAEYCLANDQVDRSKLNSEELAYAFLTQGSGALIDENGAEEAAILGWYDYYLHENHILRPANDVWVIQSSEGVRFALEMLGYYGYREGDAESGTVAFRYLSLDPNFAVPAPGDQQLLVSADADITAGVAPLLVSFQGSASGASGAVEWRWDFADGQFSALQDPQHEFQEPGVYRVRLQATDSRGEAMAVTDQLTIVVSDPATTAPVALVGDDQMVQLASPDAEALVTLDGSGSYDEDGTISEYLWTAPQGVVDPEDEVMALVNLPVGDYVFTLVVVDNEGNRSAPARLRVSVSTFDNQSPIADLGLDIASGFEPLTVEFDATSSFDPDGSIVAWQWDFADGSAPQSGPALARVSHQFQRSGDYRVTLRVIDDDGAIGVTDVQVTVLSASVKAAVIEDTFVYEFLGNLGEPEGNSTGLLVWNHESNHGAKALLAFDPTWREAAATMGNFSASLCLYQYCELEGFVGACPGDPGALLVETDVFLQTSPWSEADAIDWNSVDEFAATYSSFTQTGSSGWLEVDITELVQAWFAGTADFGLALSQEQYEVVRADSGSVAVSAFCDSESSDGVCAMGDYAPYMLITAEPLVNTEQGILCESAPP